MDVGVIPIKINSIFSRSLELGPHNQIQFPLIHRTLLFERWGGLTIFRGYSQYNLNPAVRLLLFLREWLGSLTDGRLNQDKIRILRFCMRPLQFLYKGSYSHGLHKNHRKVSKD